MNEAQGKKLLRIARETISDALDDKEYALEDAARKEFSEKQGAFVTLHIDGRLRGCIGYVEPIFPLYQTIVRAARAAAFEDPRFLPLTKEEFKDVDIEISVLTIPEKMTVKDPHEYTDHIEIGKDGLIVKHNGMSGLLLPQVATEHKLDAKTFLELTCQKAGLPTNAWRMMDVSVHKFQAEIFKEKN